MLRKVDSLDEVVAGDLIAVLSNGWGETTIEFRVVKAVTKLWIQDERTNWRRKDGMEVGASFSCWAPKIVPATEELLATYRHQRLSAWVTSRMEALLRLRVRKLPADVVLKLVDALVLAGAHAAEIGVAGPPPPSFSDHGDSDAAD